MHRNPEVLGVAMADSGIFVYVSNVGSSEIFVLRLDPDSGDLTPVQQVPAGQVMPMAISPDRRFLYATVRSQPYSVVSFATDTVTGTLTYLANAPLPDCTFYISTDRTGRFLLSASFPDTKTKPLGGIISVSPIGLHGFVQPPQQIIRTEPKAHCILT